MSIELKIKKKQELNKENENEIKKEDNSIDQKEEEKANKKKKIFEQKYKIDIIDVFGANTSDNLDNPVNFISHSNYIVYNAGYHILIRDCPPNEEEILTEKEINVQSNSFFIYLSPYLKKITSSSDKNNFAICEDLEKDETKYSSISMYYLGKLNILSYYIVEPTRKIITDKYYNFKSINFSEDNRLLCAFCNDIITQRVLVIIYNINDFRDFNLNETNPYIVIDILNEIDTKNVNINDINNYTTMVTFTKISFDNNNILCSSGNNNINFWYLSNSKLWKIPFLMAKTKNFVDHCFYKFKSRVDKNNSVLITITSINELFVIQSSDKNNFAICEDLEKDETNRNI